MDSKEDFKQFFMEIDKKSKWKLLKCYNEE